MSTVVHQVSLVSQEHFAGKLPPHQVGVLLAELPLAVRGAVSMALLNRSCHKGKRPGWPTRAGDIRFTEGNGVSSLFCWRTGPTACGRG